MKTYLSEIVPKIQHFSKKLNDLTVLQHQNWVSISEINEQKIVYIFRKNGQLLISENGLITKAVYEYINSETLMIDYNDKSMLLKHGFLDEDVMALKIDGNDGFAFFVNETNSTHELNTIEDTNKFLITKYLNELQEVKNKELENKKFYYLDKNTLEEHGPYSFKKIQIKLRQQKVSRSFYVRETWQPDYSGKRRIEDLITAFNDI
ncbi:hypothetical protein [Sediminicola luteus]|uniref:Uncharacterized protein n=1 Tax=Sediminicola luteus TaxID=319238 RepID=A0ABV2TX08_9FLAO